MATVLLVDDEKAYIETIARRLRQRGHSAECVFSGQAALDRLDRDDGVEVVLLDIQMPGLDGIQTVAKIKKAHALVEVIMLTGHASIQSAVEAVKRGAFDFLEKPCDLDAIVATIEKAVARRTDREARLLAVRSKPYISKRERDELISAILNS